MEFLDTLVLVKRGRPRAHTKGQWLLDVQAEAQKDALRVWGQKPVAPFEVIPPLKVEKASINQVWAFARSVLP